MPLSSRGVKTLIGIGLFITLFFLDRNIAFFVHTFTGQFTANLAFLITGPLFYLILLSIPLWIARHHHRAHRIIITGYCVLIAATIGQALIKSIFGFERPYLLYGWNSLEHITNASFPSGHATTIWSMVAFAWWYGNKNQHILILIFAILVMFSRMVLGVHFLSDVVTGAFLGFFLAQGTLALNQRFGFIDWLVETFRDDREFRRQIVHILFGLVLCALVFLSLLTPVLLLAIAVAGLACSWAHRRIQFTLIDRILLLFEREKDHRIFPGKGLILYVLSAWFMFSFFPQPIASAAIMILALGDGMSNIIGKKIGHTSIWYNPGKHWEGTIAGIIVGTAGAILFLPLPLAFAAASIAMLIETLPLRIGKISIDDNITIPLTAGLVVVALKALFG